MKCSLRCHRCWDYAAVRAAAFLTFPRTLTATPAAAGDCLPGAYSCPEQAPGRPLFRDLAWTFWSRAPPVLLPTAKLPCTPVPLPPFPPGAVLSRTVLGHWKYPDLGASESRAQPRGVRAEVFTHQSLSSLAEGCSQGPFTPGVLVTPPAQAGSGRVADTCCWRLGTMGRPPL